MSSPCVIPKVSYYVLSYLIHAANFSLFCSSCCRQNVAVNPESLVCVHCPFDYYLLGLPLLSSKQIVILVQISRP